MEKSKKDKTRIYVSVRDSVLLDMALVMLSDADMSTVASVYHQASIIRALIEKGLLASGISPKSINSIKAKSNKLAERYIYMTTEESIRTPDKKDNIRFDYF